MNKIPSFTLRLLFLLIVTALQQRANAQAPALLWQRCYGGDSTDLINCLRQTSDGGYIAAGYTASTDGDLAGNGGVIGLWVLKLDPFGNIQWEKTYGDTIGSSQSIEQTTDGGYILTCNKTIKLNGDGSIAWLTNIIGWKIHQVADGGYILCNADSLTKLHTDGSVAWTQSYNDGSSDVLGISDVCQSFINGYIITGSVMDMHPSPFISKTDATGNLLVPITNDYSHFQDILLCRSADGNYFYCRTGTSGTTISKTSEALGSIWTTTDPIPGLSITGIAPTSDTGFVGCGSAGIFDAGIYVKKFDKAGDLQWEKDLGSSNSNGGTSVFQAVNGNYVVAGNVQYDSTLKVVFMATARTGT